MLLCQCETVLSQVSLHAGWHKSGWRDNLIDAERVMQSWDCPAIKSSGRQY